MKKAMLAILMVAILAVVLAVPVFADDPTETNVTWDGAGSVVINVVAGDDTTQVFETEGNLISGVFNAVDSNNNPYNYGVDSFSSRFMASVGGTGFISSTTDRTDAYAPMYGVAGQRSWSDVGIIGGTASMAFRSTTNFASMSEGSYGYQLSGGHNVVVDSPNYIIDRGIWSGAQSNVAQFYATGSGTATLDNMVSGTSAGGLTFGRGGGCFTDANYTGAGSGTVAITGIGNNSVNWNGFGVSFGGGTSSFLANWNSTISIADYSMTIN